MTKERMFYPLKLSCNKVQQRFTFTGQGGGGGELFVQSSDPKHSITTIHRDYNNGVFHPLMRHVAQHFPVQAAQDGQLCTCGRLPKPPARAVVSAGVPRQC